MKTWVVPVAVTLAYCHAAECPGGSCATPRASLLQLKSLSQKTESLATGSGSSTSAALAGFQKFTDEMIAKYGSDGNTVTANSTELEAVNIIYNFLDEMLATFKVSHTDAKQKGDECYSFAYHTHCPFDWDTYKEFHEQWRTAQKDHYQCRRDAKVGCGDPQRHCDHYDIYRKFDTRALMPNCIKDGVFGDSWFTAVANDLQSSGHGDCNSDQAGEFGWTKGNPYAQCDGAVRAYDTNNPGEDGAKRVNLPGSNPSKKWSEATYEESVQACKDMGFSTETGQYYGNCQTAASKRDAAWTALGCGSTNAINSKTVVSSHTWSQQALRQDSAGCTGCTNANDPAPTKQTCPGCFDMTTASSGWNVGVVPSVPGQKTDAQKCAEDWGTSNICFNLMFLNYYGLDSDAVAFSNLQLPGVVAPAVTTWTTESGDFGSIADETPFIYTYGEAGEEPWKNVDECRTNVEAEILKAGNTPQYTEDDWALMRSTDYSAADAATQLKIAAALDAMTGKMDCVSNSGSAYDMSAAIMASSITTCLSADGTPVACADAHCCQAENWKKFHDYCPEVTRDYDASPMDGTCVYTGLIDLLETIYPYMEGATTSVSDVCASSTPLSTGYYYVNPLSGFHKLLKFEQCLDVTFDWLYGEKEVTETRQQAYVGSDGDSSTTTQQYSGRSLLQELYAEQTRRLGDSVDTYYAKLNGKWTGTSDARLGAFSASDKTRTTQAYAAAVANCNSPGGSSMRWTRKPGWHKSELKYVAWMEPDGERTSWGLWQHYVKCELSEQHRAATVFAEGGTNSGSLYNKKDSKADVGYWARVGESVKSSDGKHSSLGGVDESGTTYANAAASSQYTHMASEKYTNISGQESSRTVSGITITEHTHCVYIDGQCIDQYHIRCLDYYYMCAALQRRAEAAYLEWRFFRENECDSQEKCLTDGADLACNAAYSQADDSKKKDTQLYKCSETCAIEHENAKARAADVETAERLRCMLQALFGKPTGTIEKGGTGTAASGATCDTTTKCQDGLSCKNGGCVGIADVWTIPDGSTRSTRLVACNKATYNLQYWNLKQEECPSWSDTCAGVARRSYWSSTDVETGKTYSWSGGNDLLTGAWSAQNGKFRKNCGTKLSSQGDLCKTECTAKKNSYDAVTSNSTPSTEFWASWSMIYDTCKDEHFLTKGLWNTHDVCHLTVFDHDNTVAQIKDPRMRQTSSASSASTDSTYVESCYAGCSDDNDDEYSVVKTTWGKFAFDFCDSGALNADKRNEENSGISLGRKAMHALGWDNEASNTGTTRIFTYAYHTNSVEMLTTWWQYKQSASVLCTDTHLDESWTPLADVDAYDGLTSLSKAECWRSRAKNLIVDDEFGPSNCKLS